MTEYLGQSQNYKKKIENENGNFFYDNDARCKNN